MVRDCIEWMFECIPRSKFGSDNTAIPVLDVYNFIKVGDFPLRGTINDNSAYFWLFNPSKFSKNEKSLESFGNDKRSEYFYLSSLLTYTLYTKTLYERGNCHNSWY